MKKLLTLALAAVLLLSLAVSASAAAYNLKIGVVITQDDPLFAGLTEMKKEVEEKSEGRLTIDLYPSSQLGDTGEVVEQAVAGANVGTMRTSRPRASAVWRQRSAGLTSTRVVAGSRWLSQAAMRRA